MLDFLPVFLGSDANVYGMARSFYEAYGVTGAALCKAPLPATAHSRLVRIAAVEPALEQDEVFVRTLVTFAKSQHKTLLLFSCADGYTVLLARHRNALLPTTALPARRRKPSLLWTINPAFTGPARPRGWRF
ncbi:MAG: hypothetical protein ACI4OI_01830, partial [Gemmiger sp.]